MITITKFGTVASIPIEKKKTGLGSNGMTNDIENANRIKIIIEIITTANELNKTNNSNPKYTLKFSLKIFHAILTSFLNSAHGLLILACWSIILPFFSFLFLFFPFFFFSFLSDFSPFNCYNNFSLSSDFKQSLFAFLLSLSFFVFFFGFLFN